MRYAVAMSASLPQTIVELPWSADTLTVVNSTASILYVRIGGRDYPTATNYDHLVPAGGARTLPVVGSTFALSLYAGPVGAVGVGVQGFTARCDVLFLKDESAPNLSGFVLPPTTVQQTASLNTATGFYDFIIDGRGFGSVYVEMYRDWPVTFSPYHRFWGVYTGPTATGPWSRVQNFLHLSGTTGPIVRYFPTGAGYVRVMYVKDTSEAASYSATCMVNWRLSPDIASLDAPLGRGGMHTRNLKRTLLVGDPTRYVCNYSQFSGRLKAVHLWCPSFSLTSGDALAVFVSGDAGGPIYLLGQVDPSPFYVDGNGLTVLRAAQQYMTDGAAVGMGWVIPIDLPVLYGLSVGLVNVGASTLTDVYASAVMEVAE